MPGFSQCPSNVILARLYNCLSSISPYLLHSKTQRTTKTSYCMYCTVCSVWCLRQGAHARVLQIIFWMSSTQTKVGSGKPFCRKNIQEWVALSLWVSTDVRKPSVTQAIWMWKRPVESAVDCGGSGETCLCSRTGPRLQ